MIRTLLISAFILLTVAACSSTALQVPASDAFLPTPYEPTLGPTPVGLATSSPTPKPTATGTNTPTETSAPTTAATPTNTPTNTPTVAPQSIMVQVTDSQIAPSQINLTNGVFTRLTFTNQGSTEYELQVQNLQPDDVTPDESLAGVVSSDQLGTVTSDAGNGAIHLFAIPQGSAAVSFTPNKAGTYPFTVKFNDKQLNGSIIVH